MAKGKKKTSTRSKKKSKSRSSKSSKGSNGLAKYLLIIAVINGLFSVFAFYLNKSLGSWWEFTSDTNLGASVSVLVDAFGININSTGNEVELVLGGLGIFTGILMILGSILIIVGLVKDSKGIPFLSSFLMTASIGLFLYGLNNIEATGSVSGLITFLNNNTEFNPYYGTTSFTIFFISFTYTWGLGAGFFIGLAGAAGALIGAILYKK